MSAHDIHALRAAAVRLAKAFTTIMRTNGSPYTTIFSESDHAAAEAAREAVCDFHRDAFPCDTAWDTMRAAFDNVSEMLASYDDADSVGDNFDEFAWQEAENRTIYCSEVRQWYACAANASAFCAEAREESGPGESVEVDTARGLCKYVFDAHALAIETVKRFADSVSDETAAE